MNGASGASSTWTVSGDPRVEARLHELTQSAARVVRDRVPARHLGTLAVIGGYGRGEGGVERVGRELRPHNNVDLLLVTRGLGAAERARIARDLDSALADVAGRHGVPIDLGVVGTDTLRRARKQVLWYDVRHGHRTLAGDDALLAAHIRFKARAIDPRDVRDLVVNRGTLLLVNLLALDRFGQGARADAMPDMWRRRVVRHAMKAIVGYGDALLYADGAYHVSYREKRARVRRSNLVGSELSQAYEEAIAFRFEPDYPGFLAGPRGADLGAWHDELLAVVEPAHRRFLRAIHGREVAWRDYPHACLLHSLSRSARSPRDWARCARNAYAARGSTPPLDDIRSRALYLLASERDRMAALFPAACYGVGAEHPLVRACLASAPSERAGADVLYERRRLFLGLWAVHGDINIPDEVRALSEPGGESGREDARERRA